MGKIFFIKSTPLKDNSSRSTQVAMEFIDEYLSRHPYDTVEVLDLYNMNIPLVDIDVISGWKKLRSSLPLSELEALKLDTLNKLTEQFIQSDKYIIVSPLWNLGVPPLLKAYFDTVSVAGKTFRYTPNGAIGMLKDKLAIHIHGRGGIYTDGKHVEYADPYVRGILKFLGVTVLPSIYVEGIDEHPEKEQQIMEKAKFEAREAAKRFEFELAAK